MPVVIREVVSEVVVGQPPDGEPPAGQPRLHLDEDTVEDIVRRATERVLEHLRREWGR